jgi:hypothetical protein
MFSLTSDEYQSYRSVASKKQAAWKKKETERGRPSHMVRGQRTIARVVREQIMANHFTPGIGLSVFMVYIILPSL